MAGRKDVASSIGTKRKLQGEESPTASSKRAKNQASRRLTRRQAQEASPEEVEEVETMADENVAMAERLSDQSEINGTKEPESAAQTLLDAAGIDTRPSTASGVEGLPPATPDQSLLALAATNLEEIDGKVKKLKKQKTLKANKDKPESPKASWTLSRPKGGRYIDRDPVFVYSDSREECLVASTGTEVQVLSLATSLPVRSLQAPNGTTVISFDATYAEGESTIYVLHSNEKITRWNWVLDTSNETAGINTGAKMLRLGQSAERTIKLIATWKNSISTVQIDKVVSYTTRQRIDDLRVFGNLDFIVCRSHTAIIIGRKNADEGFSWTEVLLKNPVTSFDARVLCTSKPGKQEKRSPATLSLAVGLANGQIHLYSDVAQMFASKKPSTLPSPRILHWHRDAVSSVKFSPDGNYVVSGGKETVLVIWQLETGHRSFLPHLTSAIERIAINPPGNRYALKMGDNSVMVLSTTELKPVANFAGIQLSTQPSHEDIELLSSKMTAILNPQRPGQLLLTVPSTLPKAEGDVTTRPFLQLFDLRTTRHITRQALTRNNVTDFNLGPERTPIMPPDVQHLAISADGNWLATVDEWKPPTNDVDHLEADSESVSEQQNRRREVYLKFWSWDVDAEVWTLSSRIDGPHSQSSGGESLAGMGRVFKLVSDATTRYGFVTVGEDSAVRIWRPRRRLRHGSAVTNEKGVQEVDWICRKSIELEKEDERKDATMILDDECVGPSGAALAISDDGSMIAASMRYQYEGEDFGTANIAFIDAETGDMKACKDNIADECLVNLAFMDRYLIALSRKALRVWDLVDDKLHHSFKVPSGSDEMLHATEPLLAVNKANGTVAIAKALSSRGDGALMVFGIAVPSVQCRLSLEKPVAALLASDEGRGFVAVSADGTTRALSSGAQPRAIAQAEESTDIVMDAEIETAISQTELKTLVASSDSEQDKTGNLAAAGVEDDRPVVRPEQLARVFDVGHGIAALPSVRDMFHAVANLYGRKPRMMMAHG